MIPHENKPDPDAATYSIGVADGSEQSLLAAIAKAELHKSPAARQLDLP